MIRIANLNDVTRLLSSRRVALVRELRSAAAQLGHDEPDEPGESDYLAGLIESETVELSALDHALERCRFGAYGRCEACGGPIPRERLRAIPHASLCVPCQARAERNR